MKAPKNHMKWIHDKEEGIRQLHRWEDGEWVPCRMMVLPSPPPHKGYCVYDSNRSVSDGGIIVAGLPLSRALKMGRAMN